MRTVQILSIILSFAGFFLGYLILNDTESETGSGSAELNGITANVRCFPMSSCSCFTKY